MLTKYVISINTFRISGPLWGISTDHRWIIGTKGQWWWSIKRVVWKGQNGSNDGKRNRSDPFCPIRFAHMNYWCTEFPWGNCYQQCCFRLTDCRPNSMHRMERLFLTTFWLIHYDPFCFFLLLMKIWYMRFMHGKSLWSEKYNAYAYIYSMIHTWWNGMTENKESFRVSQLLKWSGRFASNI